MREQKSKSCWQSRSCKVVQAHNFKIKVLFEDGTDSKLQFASNFEHCDGKRKRGEGDEDDNKEGDEMEEDEKEDNFFSTDRFR